MESFEVAIVGGGPAGLATGLFLIDAEPSLAEDIVVLEKEKYPAVGSMKPCSLASAS